MLKANRLNESGQPPGEEELAMHHELKIFGLAATAALALAAAVAPTAAATNFTSEGTPTFLKGEGATVTLTVNAITVKCQKVVWKSAEIVGSSISWIEISPEYVECTTFGQETSVVTTGCTYKLTASSATAGATQFVCSGSNQIVIAPKGAGCTIKIKSQTPTTPTVDYTNMGTFGGGLGTADFSVKDTVGGIAYTSSGGVCGASGTNGTTVGEVTVKGYSSSAYSTQRGIKVD
jgi:hypothetical protein